MSSGRTFFNIDFLRHSRYRLLEPVWRMHVRRQGPRPRTGSHCVRKESC